MPGPIEGYLPDQAPEQSERQRQQLAEDRQREQAGTTQYQPPVDPGSGQDQAANDKARNDRSRANASQDRGDDYGLSY